jgi:hypothetical protein
MLHLLRTRQDMDLCRAALDFTEQVLVKLSNPFAAARLGGRSGSQLVQLYDGIDALEALQYAGGPLAARAQRLVDRFFGEDYEEHNEDEQGLLDEDHRGDTLAFRGMGGFDDDGGDDDHDHDDAMLLEQVSAPRASEGRTALQHCAASSSPPRQHVERLSTAPYRAPKLTAQFSAPPRQQQHLRPGELEEDAVHKPAATATAFTFGLQAQPQTPPPPAVGRGRDLLRPAWMTVPVRKPGTPAATTTHPSQSTLPEYFGTSMKD